MNILVIGNGFDLAHGLPTTYLDFLRFINCVKEVIRPINRYGDINSILMEIKPNIRQILVSKYKQGKWITDKLFIDSVTDNLWIEYFNKKYKRIGETWIDFEKEISNVVQTLDKLDNDINKMYGYEPDLADILSEYGVEDNKISNLLVSHLNRLINALEIYLRCYVCEIKTDCFSPDIRGLSVDAVLSFNYTNTYNRLYSSGKLIKYNYIHGNINFNNEKNYINNMVLGIDEYLEGKEKDTKLEYVELKKYFQRIYKATGSLYKKWLEEGHWDYNIYFFGHSLNETDKDILRDIILNESTKIFIYYHNKQVYAKLIKNLINVIGQDKLIEMTGGATPKIEFRLQKDMEKISV